jgi:hypothetical protein
MSVYMGICTLHPDFAAQVAREAREGAGFQSAYSPMSERVRQLRENPPEGLKMLGSYNARERGFIVVETDDHRVLTQVSQHYWGCLEIEWIPVTAAPLPAD